MAERRERSGPGGEWAAGDGATGPRLRLGEWLRTTRLRRGFSFAEIERDTRINRLYLEALEEEHYEVLPAPVYTRGFVRSYARALGLDPAEAIAMLPAELPVPPGLEPITTMRDIDRDAPALSLPSMRQLGVPAFNISAHSDVLRWGAIAVGVVVLIAAIWLASGLFGGSEAPAPTSNTPPASQAPVTTPAAVAPAAVATSTGATSPAAAPVAADQAPNFIGMQQEAAQRTLQERGVTMVTVGIPSNDVPAGQVVGQTPSAGAPLKRGDNMTLVVSRGTSR